jgi:signal transduction histidine kinase
VSSQPSPEDSAKQIEGLRAEVVSLKSQLEQTTNSTNQYLQNVAHQLTAPLNAIKWSIESLKDPKVRFERKMKLLSSIYSQGTILVHLIKNFSLMSNLEADHELGQFRERPEHVHPLRLAINLANDFQPQAAEGGKKIVVDEESFSEVFGDKDILVVKNLIAQALSNLLENAVKYSNLNTTIRVEAIQKRIPKIGEGVWTGISIQSTGLPIQPSEFYQLTERGFRGSAAKQRIPAGTGIGLYLADRVMKLHQGALYGRAEGSTATFMLVFPERRIQ